MNGALRKQLSLNGSNPGFKQETYIAKITAIESGVMLVLKVISVHGRPLDKRDVTSLDFSCVMSELQEVAVSVRIA